MKVYSAQTKKLVKAALIGPLAILPALFIYTVGDYIVNPKLYASADWSDIIFVYVLFGLFFSYLGTVLLGLPAGVILTKLNQFRILNLIFVSLILAVLISLYLGFTANKLLFFSYCSCFVAVGCWVVYQNG
jgi:hypothetical protein